MASGGKKRRADASLIADTGPKRRRRGKRDAVLTPVHHGSTVSKRPRRKNTPRSELVETTRELIDAARVASITPHSHPFHPTTLTPTPAPPRHSAVTPVAEATPTLRQRTLRSALKDIHSFSSLRRSTHSGSRVSFGQSVVTEYTPPSSSGESSRDEPGSSHSASDSLLGVSLELEPIEEGEDEEEDEEEEERGGKKEEEEGGSEGVATGSENEGEMEEGGGRVGLAELVAPTVSPISPTRKTTPKLDTPKYSELRPTSRRAGGRQRAAAGAKRPARQPPSHKKPAKTLTRSLMKNLLMLSCKRRVTKAAMDLVMKFSELYLKQASEDLAVFAAHGGRRTVEVRDVMLLMNRQRATSERESFEYLANCHLPLDYVEELLPCALAGKTVEPHS